jgi:hypothetical protein
VYGCGGCLAVATGHRDGKTTAADLTEGNHMRRIGALLSAALVALVCAVPASAATTLQVSAFIKENFERAPSDIPCEFDEVAETLTCFGRGNAGRFGQLTSVVVFDDGSVTRTITFGDGSTIVLAEEYPMDEYSTPGNAFNAPGQMISFGNPAFQTGTFEVIDATGNLEGTTGSGTISQVLAGNTIQIFFSGTITLP